MLQAYMDDSGSHDGARVCTLAGYFGGWRRWMEFELAWGKVLLAYNVEEFHARRFWGRDKQGYRLDEYKSWDDKKAKRFLGELLTIIESSKEIHPFASGVVASEWEQQTLSDRRMFTGASPRRPSGKPSKSIFLALQRCVICVARYCKPGIKANYFIDSNKQLDAWATICFYEMKERYKQDNDDICLSMGTLTPDDSKTALPLQAADLLAYEARLYAENVIVTGNRNTMRETYRRALANIRSEDDFWLFDERRFGWLRNVLDASRK